MPDSRRRPLGRAHAPVARPAASARPPASEKRRRLLDIEEALAWAVREELPKRRDGQSHPAAQVSPMFRLAQLGGRIDSWSREPGFPAALGDPHPDALAIERALSELSLVLPDGATAGLSPNLGFPDLDEAAALRTFAGRAREIVVIHAKLGGRPALNEGSPGAGRRSAPTASRASSMPSASPPSAHLAT
jgi:hypothetical protein